MQTLTCPIDETTLADSKLGGQPSMKCPQCGGAWISLEDLESLEDRHFREDMVKGQRRYGEHPIDHACPHCSGQMTRFRYRGYNLELEACPSDAGFWLDQGEDSLIRDVMKRRVSNLSRAGSAQKDWDRFRRGGGRSIFDKIKDLFSG